MRGDGGDDFDGRLGQHVQEAAYLGAGPAELPEDVFAVEQLLAREVAQVGLLQDEGVGFQLELPDRDPHRRHAPDAVRRRWAGRPGRRAPRAAAAPRPVAGRG